MPVLVNSGTGEQIIKAMRLARFFALLAALLIGGTVLTAAPAWAGSAHFVDSKVQATQDGDTLTVTGKEAGLGDEDQVHIVLTADVQCWNRGGNQPQAENKAATLAEGSFPVQNGKADFTLSGVGTTSPDCSPPMEIRYANIVVTDTTNGISVSVTL